MQTTHQITSLNIVYPPNITDNLSENDINYDSNIYYSDYNLGLDIVNDNDYFNTDTDEDENIDINFSPNPNPIPEQIHDFSNCFYCNSSTHQTSICPNCIGDIYCLRYFIFTKIRNGSLTKENLRKIFVNNHDDYGINTIGLAISFGYLSNINYRQALEICMIMFGISCGWYSSRGDQEYIDAATSAWIVRDINLHTKQIERQREWDSQVPNHRMIPPPLFSLLQKPQFQLYKKFAAKGMMRKLFMVMYYGDEVISPSILEHLILRRRDMIDMRNYLHSDTDNDTDNDDLYYGNPPYINDVISQKRKMKNIWKTVAILKEPIESYDEKQEEPEKCPVCVEDLTENKIVITNCHHKLCSDCIEKVFEKCGKRCVSCRTDITTLQFDSKDQIIRYQDIKIQTLV